MKRRTATWTVFGVGAVAGVAMLTWLTVTLLRLERSEATAQAITSHELAVGAALWQMDAWLLPIVAEESQRAPTDYAAFNPIAQAFTNRFAKLNSGDVIAPSPLLGYRSDYFPLHFQVDARGAVTSPQVPEGNELDVAQSQVEGLDIEARRALLAEIKPWLSRADLLMSCSLSAESLPEQQLARNAPEPQLRATDPTDDLGMANYKQRAQSTARARQSEWVTTNSTTAQLGFNALTSAAMVPIWLGPAERRRLVFVRKTTLNDQTLYQGVLADWQKLSTGMLAQIRDQAIARNARLVPIDKPDIAANPHLLTVLPAALETPRLTEATLPWSPTRTLLTIGWAAFALIGAAVAFTLHAALAFGDRRARFASAVTHELRTPLTTFKMYSEMLARGMVRDADKQQQYLNTLQSEADRLARLVENVLGYARIEDGRFTAHRQTLAVADLLARVVPVLRRRAEEGGYGLEVVPPAEPVHVEVDVDALTQILFNLVDNACKYGRPPLHLSAGRIGASVRIVLQDHGDGVPERYRRSIFAAFDRGPHQPGDNEKPGVGLGLALARGLARDLGGDLTLDAAPGGARFVLELPAIDAPA